MAFIFAFFVYSSLSAYLPISIECHLLFLFSLGQYKLLSSIPQVWGRANWNRSYYLLLIFSLRKSIHVGRYIIFFHEKHRKSFCIESIENGIFSLVTSFHYAFIYFFHERNLSFLESGSLWSYTIPLSINFVFL